MAKESNTNFCYEKENRSFSSQPGKRRKSIHKRGEADKKQRQQHPSDPTDCSTDKAAARCATYKH